MNRATINFWLDTLLLLLFSALLAVAIIVRFVFPPYNYAHGWLLWGYTFHDWLGFQFNLVVVLAVAILVHVMLHWSWVCGWVATHWSRDKKAKVDEGMQTIYGVITLMAVLAVVVVFVASAKFSIVFPAQVNAVR